jgi:hypothetical protein
LGDWLETSRERASFLVLFSIIYCEEWMTQFMDNLLVALYKVVLEKSTKQVRSNIELSLKFLGRYCSPKSYQQLLMSALKNELASFYSYTQPGALKALGFLFEGSCELLWTTQEMDRMQDLMNEFVHFANTELADQLDLEIA